MVVTAAKVAPTPAGRGWPERLPEATPIADMKPEHQAAYWKHQSRKHGDTAKARADYEAIKAERDQLKASTQTDAEKAIVEARADERAKAEKDTASKYQARLVAAEVKAALAATKFPADKIAGQVEFLDHSKFLTADGEVDADKVKQYAAGLAPMAARGPTWAAASAEGTRPARACPLEPTCTPHPAARPPEKKKEINHASSQERDHRRG